MSQEYTCTLDHDGWQLYDSKGVKAVARHPDRQGPRGEVAAS
jgi:predicted RNA binding protein YcfA (HicA-like mRNA interferase family)